MVMALNQAAALGRVVSERLSSRGCGEDHELGTISSHMSACTIDLFLGFTSPQKACVGGGGEGAEVRSAFGAHLTDESGWKRWSGQGSSGCW